MFKVFPKGMVVLNSVKFETRSIVQIECHLKRTHEMKQTIFFYWHKFANTIRTEAKKASNSSHA